MRREAKNLMRVGLQTAFFAVLIGVAIVYFAVPARALGHERISASLSLTGSSAAPTLPAAGRG